MGTMTATSATLNATQDIPLDEESMLNSWALLATPWPVLAILSSYLGFVLWLGPSIMRQRKAMDLRHLMMVYNLYQVIYNGALVGWFFTHSTAISYVIEHGCHPLDPKLNPLRTELHLASWCYLFAKIVDMIDTVFMILRKKDSHVTFLHLYHHTSMVAFSWLSVKYIQAEQGIVLGVLNSFVHVVMYTYYFLAGLGPEVQKYLWWKKYITKLQLTQFVFAISFMVYLLYNRCTVPQVYNVIWVVNVAVIMALFVNFYIQTYIKKPAQIKKTK
ncbi:elongation of very long chain fatty acids protein 4-like isoform X1 [Macrosteles quadrilineatus]|uniref:elongation of very long chain fatty acids protein 4-like isoform X1 n=1 Tax=Macrosteles quadrilineatus TaxID=74068 RepID=UPI0023E2915E|nr:elongation of very long chain fatty acids protein 4-like isoform X1 [Macrosteles quadrilineatus]